MEKGLKFFFDKASDTLDITIGNPQTAISQELENDVVVRVDPQTHKIVGFTILNFEKRFTHLATAEKVPIDAAFSQMNESSQTQQS